MSTDLYRVSSISWAVKSKHDQDIQHFSTIEGAAEYLESIGVLSDEVDIAITELAGNSHTRANFGIHGRFVFSDRVKTHETFGVA